MRGQSSPGQGLCDAEAAIRDYLACHDYTQALELLLKHYQDGVLRYCHCHLADLDMAREVAQEVFLAAFEAMPRFRGQATCKTWLYGIAAKKCLEAGRNNGRRDQIRQVHQQAIIQGAHCNPPQQPEEACQQARQRQLVWQALQQLRRQDRELVVLRYLEELTYDEIALILHVSKRTIERRLPLAQVKFHKVYERCQKPPMVYRARTANDA